MSAEMTKHEVAFNIGRGSVVCTCGESFKTPTYSSGDMRDGLDLWADHLRSTQ